jgi:glycosyltransferase involved in cell wall biosynthesis
MRILLNLTQLNLNRTGIDVYTENVAAELVRQRRASDTILVLALDDDTQLLERLNHAGQATIVLLPARAFRNRIFPLIFEQIALPYLARKYKADILHCFRFNFPWLRACPRVVTIHDFSAFLWPETVPLFRRLLVRTFTRLALRHAECVLFVSQSAQHDAETMFGTRAQLRAVTPLGVNPQTLHSNPAGQAHSIVASRGVDEPFLLFVGSIDPRKNLSRAVQAFDRVAAGRNDLQLVLAGRDTGADAALSRAIDASPRRMRIHKLGYVSDEEKRALLQACAALVYPSLYEGFGLPILEGMAAGAPVITSNVSSMPEVAGTAALCVDPASVADIAHQIVRVLDDAELRERLILAGRQRVSEFTWQRTAEKTYQAYESIARRSQRSTATSICS